jgi:serine/threonine-protein kinase RsbW
MSESKTTNVEVRVPSRMGFEKVAMSTAAAVAKLMGFREDRIEDLKTAVAEACINAIEHGNRLNEKLSVGVVLSAGADSLEVKVIDDGKGERPSRAKWTSRTSTARCTARKTRAGWACS